LSKKPEAERERYRNFCIKEGESLQKLQHPNIIGYYKHGMSEDGN
jgi:hypothetical protein